MASTPPPADGADVPGPPGEVAWSCLNGARVLDLSRLLPGPFATMLLADLGADVVKVEDAASGGDPLRAFGRRRFAVNNRNKRSVALDLRSAEGRAAFLRLAGRADAVVESFRPGVLDEMGLGYERLRAANPGIVLCSLSGFGQDGPYAGRPGHDLNFLGLSGFFAVPSRPDAEVTRPGVRVGDLIGSMYAALSLAVAMMSAGRNGTGQHLDLSLHDAATAWAGPAALSLAGLAAPSDSPLVMGDNSVFATSDGRLLSLATFEDKFWRAFRERLAGTFPDLDTAAFDGRAERTRRKREVERILTRTFAARDLAWWSRVLDEAGVPWAPVLTGPDDLLNDPHIAARELIADTADGPAVRFPTRFGLGLDTFRRPAPELGEHTAELLGEAAPARSEAARGGAA
ncbi:MULTISPECIES: CaiB/BaiF CoA transferase family protein [Actinomadura]|uniref:CaiB/BaiF CoA transferase family protein n=1 Tax=Actinomadura yumaensis TaxID=111807 RepID=A0ABW2CEH2_9ACTN|nr:CaiB/BaiF CoA-transferase family protein [Actinomadura sp. J1-007]MWK35560.1 CoA transferase [Actinomadura sp. J1-007]